MREAGMEEEVEQLKEIGKNVNAMGVAVHTSLQEQISKVDQELQHSGEDLSAWTTTVDEPPTEPVIQPPARDLSAWTTAPEETPDEPATPPPAAEQPANPEPTPTEK